MAAGRRRRPRVRMRFQFLLVDGDHPSPPRSTRSAVQPLGLNVLEGPGRCGTTVLLQDFYADEKGSPSATPSTSRCPPEAVVGGRRDRQGHPDPLHGRSHDAQDVRGCGFEPADNALIVYEEEGANRGPRTTEVQITRSCAPCGSDSHGRPVVGSAGRAVRQPEQSGRRRGRRGLARRPGGDRRRAVGRRLRRVRRRRAAPARKCRRLLRSVPRSGCARRRC